MKNDVEFVSEGVRLRGWIETPEGPGPFPTIAFAHGFSAVKEVFLDRYSEAFRDAGFATIVWDHACFGASEGEPRYEVDPWRQIRGYRDAITFASLQPELDANRIGVWGTSYSGGHVLVVGALDPRVRCVVSQVPFVSGWQNARRVFREEEQAELHARFETDRVARMRGEPPAMMEVFGETGSLCALPSSEELAFVKDAGLLGTPLWENVVTLRSVEMMAEYEPGSYAAQIAPAALLMIVTGRDDVTPSDIAQDAFARAREPKRLLVLKGGHMEVYDHQRERATREAIDWFRDHLA